MLGPMPSSEFIGSQGISLLYLVTAKGDRGDSDDVGL